MLPRKVRIAYRDYRVRRNLKIDEYGNCDTHQALIEIGEHHDAKSEANTLLHEIGHAVYFETGLRARAGEAKEEDIVRSMVDGLCKVLADNPKMALRLFEQLEVIKSNKNVSE